MPAPRYVSPAASAPMLSFKDGNFGRGFVRWKVVSVRTGRTLQASEWLPNDRFGREAVERMMRDVSAEQRTAAKVRALGLTYEESL